MRATLLLALLAPLSACQDYDLQAKDGDQEGTSDSDSDTDPGTGGGDDRVCDPMSQAAEAAAPNDTCDYSIGGFEPIVEWAVTGEWSTSLPVVADLDGDGVPEVAIILAHGLMEGRLAVYHGDGSGLFWENTSDNMGYGSAPAIADLDDDGVPELLVVREYASGLWSSGDYTVICYSWDGEQIWESDHFTDRELDYATGIVVSDMDHDGEPEIVAGAAILRPDGTTRAVGAYSSRGCPTDPGIEGLPKEGAFPAVADLDLDGEEEIIMGNVMYDADAGVKWRDGTNYDGAVSVANLDADPEGEFVVVWANEVRAHDTDGTLLWGPKVNRNANIFPVAAIGDVDADGSPEIVVSGGNELWVLRADGTELWTHPATDMTGATGASIFDFDADGIPEVVYVDEVEMYAFNGADGAVKFHATDHGSVTMYDYPVVADVDADGHAEILVANQTSTGGLVVYGDATNSWAPVRKVWNQHAYTITNINDDLSVPVDATPNFTLYNSYHSALSAPPGEALDAELESDILGICEDDCDSGTLRVLVRARNTGGSEVDAGLGLALYTVRDGTRSLAATTTLSDALASEMASAGIELEVSADDARRADSLLLVVDDDGTGTGLVAECLEDNNGFELAGPFCQ